jgi:glycerophosphoryl diester phosphodiesterase
LITSFDRQCIDALVGEEPAVELGYLAKRPLRADGPVKTQALPYDAILAEPAIVAAVHAARGRVWAWTVDDPETARQLVDLGVDGLISNDPGRLRSGKTAP